MGKRKRASQQRQGTTLETAYAPARTRLNINSWENVADSEDEFHHARDKIFLEEGPHAKKLRQQTEEDEAFEASDEEVLGFQEDEELDSVEESDSYEDKSSKEHEQDRTLRQISKFDDHAHISEDEIDGDFGPDKQDYYGGSDEEEEDEDAAQRNYEEALRIQSKERKDIGEAAFLPNIASWLDDGKEDKEPESDGQGAGKSQKAPFTDDMNEEQRSRIMQKRYPELDHLTRELYELQPIHELLKERCGLRREAERLSRQEESSSDPVTAKYRAVSSYLGAISMYLALLTSASSPDGRLLPMAHFKLRQHPIMDALVRCREMWQLALQLPEIEEADSPGDEGYESANSDEQYADVAASRARRAKPRNKQGSQKSKSQMSASKSEAKAASQARRLERLQRAKASAAALSHRPSLGYQQAAAEYNHGFDSDLGDEAPLAAEDLAEKARRKKSLRFYTSQIAQKANRRENVTRGAGGDEDLPYKERRHDKQERLLKEAEARGRRGAKGADLDDDAGEGSESETNAERAELEAQLRGDDADEFEHYALSKKKHRRDREDAYSEARAQNAKVTPHVSEEVGPDGKRGVTYAIAKNKGITPRRKKEVKNPRVKKRLRFEDKKKKLSSMKPVYKGGEGRGGYKGELTGIKPGLVRSVKL